MTESASGRDRLWWRSTGGSTGGAISAPGSADMKAGSSGGGAGAREVTGMDTVSWLSFLPPPAWGRPWGAVPDGAGGLPVSESPRAEAAGHPGRGAGLCWSSSMGAVPCWKNGGSSGGGGSRPPLSLTGGQAGCPPAGGDHPGPGGALPGERLGDSGVRPGLCGSPAGGGRLRRSGACGKRRGENRWSAWRERPLVVRDADLLHQVGWRYVNLFVHGEPLACWRVS